MQVTSSLTNVLTPTAIALGNFDGIHQGHQQVIRPILTSSHSNGQTPYKTVVTFHPHPQEFFSGQPRRLLTPLNEKVSQLALMGVDQLVLLPFDRELVSLSPEQFVEKILINGLQAKRISVGLDFCFGKGRMGTAEDLQAIATRHGIEVEIAPLKRLDETRISSSAIRQALQEGNISYANYLLGRPYTLIGRVIQGQQLGRKLGFPTANLQLPEEKFLPRNGVYAVRVQFCDMAGNVLDCSTSPLHGVMNIGDRPTVNGLSLTVEAHLFDWAGNLYDKVLSVSLEHFIRPEQKFASLDELKSQIEKDCKTAQSLLFEPHPA